MSSLESKFREEDSAIKLLPLVHFLAGTLQTTWSSCEGKRECNVINELCNELVNSKHKNTVNVKNTSTNVTEVEETNTFRIPLPLHPPISSSSSQGSSRVSHIIDELLSDVDYRISDKCNTNENECIVNSNQEINDDNNANANVRSKQTSSAFYSVWLPILQRWYQHEKHNLENANLIKDNNDDWFADDLLGRIYMDYLEKCIETKVIANFLQSINHNDIYVDTMKIDSSAPTPTFHSESGAIKSKTSNVTLMMTNAERMLSLSMQQLFSLCSVTHNFSLLAKTVGLTLLLQMNKLLHCAHHDKSVACKYIYSNYNVCTKLEESNHSDTPIHVTSEWNLPELELYYSYLYKQVQDIRVRQTAMEFFYKLTACIPTESNSQVDDNYWNGNIYLSDKNSNNSDDDDDDDDFDDSVSEKGSNCTNMKTMEISDSCWLEIMSLLVEMQTQLSNLNENFSHDVGDNHSCQGDLHEYNSKIEEQNKSSKGTSVVNDEINLLHDFIALLQENLISHAKCKLFLFALEQYNSNIADTSINTKNRVDIPTSDKSIKKNNLFYNMSRYALWKQTNKNLRLPLTDNIPISSPVLWQCLFQTNNLHTNQNKTKMVITTCHNNEEEQSVESTNVDYMQWWRLHSECTQRMQIDESITLSTADVYLQRQMQWAVNTDCNYDKSTICGADWQILQPTLMKMERYYNLMEIRFYHTQFNFEQHQCKNGHFAMKSKTTNRKRVKKEEEKENGVVCENKINAIKGDVCGNNDNIEEDLEESSQRLLQRVCQHARESLEEPEKEIRVNMTAWEMWQETQFTFDAFFTHLFIHYYHASCFVLLRPERQRQLARVLKELGIFTKRIITIKLSDKKQEEELTTATTTKTLEQHEEKQQSQEEKELIMVRSHNNDESEEWNSDEEDVIFGMTDENNLFTVITTTTNNNVHVGNNVFSHGIQDSNTPVKTHASLELINDKMPNDWQEHYKPLTQLLFANYNDWSVIPSNGNSIALSEHHTSVCNDMSFLLFIIHATLTLLERQSKLTSTVVNKSNLFTSSSSSVMEDSWQSLLWRVLVPLLSMYSLSQAANSALNNIFTSKNWLHQVKFVLWAMLECSLFALPWSEQGIYCAMQKYTVVQEYWLNYHDRGLLESHGLEKLQTWLLHEEGNNTHFTGKSTPFEENENNKDAPEEERLISLPPSVDELELCWSPTILSPDAAHHNRWNTIGAQERKSIVLHYPFPVSLLFMQGVVKTMSARFYQLQCAWERNRRGNFNTNLVDSSDNVNINNHDMSASNNNINSIDNIINDGMNVHHDNILDGNQSSSNGNNASQLDYMLDVDALVEDELANDHDELYEEKEEELEQSYLEETGDSRVHSSFVNRKNNQLRETHVKRESMQKEYHSECLILELQEQQMYCKRINQHDTNSLEFNSFCTQSDIDVFTLLVNAVHRGCLAFQNAPTLAHTSELWEELRKEIQPEYILSSSVNSQSCSLLQWWLAHLTHLFTFYVPSNATSTISTLYSMKYIKRKLFTTNTNFKVQCKIKVNNNNWHAQKNVHSEYRTKMEELPCNVKHTQGETTMEEVNYDNNKDIRKVKTANNAICNKCDIKLVNWFTVDVSSFFTSSHSALRIALGRELAHLALSSLTTMKNVSQCSRTSNEGSLNYNSNNDTAIDYNEKEEMQTSKEQESLESNYCNIWESELVSCPIALPLLPESLSWVRYWSSIADEITLMQWTQLNDVLDGICVFTRITLFDTILHGDVEDHQYKNKEYEEKKTFCSAAAYSAHVRRCRCQNVKRILHSFLGWDGFLSFAQQLHLYIVNDDNDTIGDARLQHTLHTLYCAAYDIWRMLESGK